MTRSFWACSLLLGAAVLSCGRPAALPRGPIVLITVGGLRADVVGGESREPRWTARLNQLAATADWAGTAVTASSDPLVSLTSLLCGVRPWQHQALTAERPWRRGLPTLADHLGGAGYRTRAWVPGFLHRSLGPGFDQVEGPVSGRAALAAVAAAADETFVWLHFPDPEITRGRWQRGADGRRLTRHRLLAYADPRTPLPAAERDELWNVYGRGVRRLDRLLGEMLDVLRRSGAWERAWVVVTAAHGSELGEHGQILHGENLGRESIEVPLLLWAPGEVGPLAVPAGGRVAQLRIWPTLAGAAGRELAPVHPPSLLRGAGAPALAADPILSELYGRNGVNRFSLLDGDLQLHWTTRFSAAEPEYYRARRVQAGARAQILREPARRIFARLDTAFRQALPLSGPPGTQPQLALERWTPQGVERVDDPAAARDLALRLRRHWLRFVGRERRPAEEQSGAKTFP